MKTLVENTLVDNLIAYRVLSLLVKPFVESEAFKLGIIDETGKVLIKAKDLKTQEQRNAYSYLHRLVFNLKRLLNKLPGGDAKLKNLIAALLLLRESLEKKTPINEDRLIYLVNLINEGVVFAEEQLIVKKFLMLEDAPVNATGPAVATDQPVIRKRKKLVGKSVRKLSSYLNTL